MKPEETGSTAGPDRFGPATGFTTTSRTGFVNIRVDPEKSEDDGIEPISVPTLLKNCAQKNGEATALCVKRDGQWLKWTYDQYYAEVRSVAKAFIKLGLQPRHGVAILGFNSPEWFFSELGAIFAGGISTGIYPTNRLEACKHILTSCQANILVVEDTQQLEKVLPLRDQLPHLVAIVQYTGTPSHPDIISWESLLATGRKESNEALDQRLSELRINECCHLVYTSGTMGPPKAVMLSHDNLVFTARMLWKKFRLVEAGERYISYLPLSHVAANISDIFLSMVSLNATYFADKSAMKGTLINTIREVKPTIFLGVPRVWEKIQEKMKEIGKANKGLKQHLGNWAKKTGLKFNQQVAQGQSQGRARPTRPPLNFQLANLLAFKKVKAGLGFGKCTKFYCAAAPLSKDTLDYFLSLDIRILEIFGMSECSGPHLTNTNEDYRLGTLGLPLPGFHSMLKPVNCDSQSEHGISSEQGTELCMKGRHVMMGYLDNEAKTSEAIDEDGWLHSGDLGLEDEDGYIRLTGRLKELLITAGGENVAPVPIEQSILTELPCLSNAMLIGDRKKFLSCLLTLKSEVNPETLEPKSDLAPSVLEWCESLGSKARSVDDITNNKDPIVTEAIQAGIDRVNIGVVSRAQKVQKWVVLAKDFSIPGGELGPTMKLKRHVVLEKYLMRIEALYA